MKKSNKKGFTIVELVIVIAVIAILAAVLIPTFSNLIKKANMSADQQAVRQMNTALAADGAVTPTDIFALHEVLAELGLSSEDYKPLTKDTYFFWDADLNRVLHVDANDVVLYPAEYKGQTYEVGTSNWYSLSLEIAEEEVAITNNAVTVANGKQMKYVINQIKAGTKTLNITLNGTVDMMGAIFDMPTFATNAGYNVTISGGNIKNATAIDYAQGATSQEDGHDGVYNCALFPEILDGNSLTISNVKFENINIKNTNSGNVALLIGCVCGDVTLENVTIVNSTVIGHRSVGSLIGSIGMDPKTQAYGRLTLKGNINLKDVDVKTVGGRSGMLVGLVDPSATVTTVTKNADETDAVAAITLDSCTYGIYECVQNTGSNLGLQEDGVTLKSYTIRLGEDGQYVNTPESKYYVAKSLAMTKSNAAEAKTSDFYGATITGWN